MNNNDEWNTPQYVIEKVKNVLGIIELDPMSNKEAQYSMQALKFYTKEDDGLTKKWEGKVFINPPFSPRLLKQSINKLVHHFKLGDITEFILLTNSGTDTLWNKPLQQFTQVYTNGRMKFDCRYGFDSIGTSRGQCFTYGGPNIDKFIKTFTEDEFCWLPNKVLL